MPDKDFYNIQNKVIARMLVDTCVRSSFIENLHAGKRPITQTGDYSDVKVVFPNGTLYSDLNFTYKKLPKPQGNAYSAMHQIHNCLRIIFL